MTDRIEPDEDLDVIVHYTQVIDVVERNVSMELWSVFLGSDHRCGFDTEAEALRAARALAVQVDRPAWLHKQPYPMERIEP